MYPSDLSDEVWALLRQGSVRQLFGLSKEKFHLVPVSSWRRNRRFFLSITCW